MTPGEKIVYMCQAGFRWDAWVRAIRPNGTIDLGSDVGCKDLHELTRIEAVPPDQLRPGTCCEVVYAQQGDAGEAGRLARKPG